MLKKGRLTLHVETSPSWEEGAESPNPRSLQSPADTQALLVFIGTSVKSNPHSNSFILTTRATLWTAYTDQQLTKGARK